jgi:ankyrin repeat protein
MSPEVGGVVVVGLNCRAGLVLSVVRGFMLGGRYILTSAAPPNQEVAFGILECQPTGVPTDTDRALMDACHRGDPAAVAAALSTGGRVDALDERGMAPLDLATAYRQPAAVTVLLAAGADPDLQTAYGNAPHFAALDHKQKARPCAEQIEDADHWQILRALVDAGARVNAANLTGPTVLDLAIATRPYPEEAVRFLVAKGAQRPARRRVTHRSAGFAAVPRQPEPGDPGEPSEVSPRFGSGKTARPARAARQHRIRRERGAR